MRHAIITDETVVQSDNLAAEVVLDLFGQDGPPPVTVEALLEFLAERVARDAWAEQARFEVVLRVTEEGDRYLFVLNPSPDEARSDTVRMSLPVQAATDVSVAGGFPVPVSSDREGAAIDMTLGPCETAVVWVR